MIQDAKCWVALNYSANMLVPWYLMGSYMFHWNRAPILSAGLFDLLSQRLRAEYHLLVHDYKPHVRRSDLRAGICTMGEGDYPAGLRALAWRLAEEVPAKKPERARLRRRRP